MKDVGWTYFGDNSGSFKISDICPSSKICLSSLIITKEMPAELCA